MRTLPLWMLLLVLPSFAVAPGRARAQNFGAPDDPQPPPGHPFAIPLEPSRVRAQAEDVGAQISFVNRRQFLIPFDPVPTPHLVKQLRLYVSRDQGKHWDPFAVAPPDQVPPKFHFT